MNIKGMLIRDEGRESTAYPDPLTHGEPFTIGVGHCGPEVVPGLVWDDSMIDDALQLDIATAEQGCQDNIPCFDALNEARQAVLINMAFQLGVPGLLGFTTFLGLLRAGQFTAAADDLRNTKWAHQTPMRATRLAAQLDSGDWVA